jgi:hypothetical protein
MIIRLFVLNSSCSDDDSSVFAATASVLMIIRLFVMERFYSDHDSSVSAEQLLF